MSKGTYNHSIDAKGRLTIPARFRDELGERFVVTRGFDDCLAAYSVGKWTTIEDKLNAIPITNTAGRKLRRVILGNAIECEVDKMGRILIPANLRALAHLKKDVSLTGVGDFIEIRDNALWNDFNENGGLDNMTEEELAKLEELDL